MHDGLRVDVPWWSVTGEQPWGTDSSASSAQIRSMAKVVVELGGEGLRDGDWCFAERDVRFSVGVDDGGGLQGRDLGQRLSVEQQQDAGDSVGQAFGVAGEQFFEPGQSLLLSDRRGCFRLPVPDLDGDVELALVGPDEERSDQVSGGWT